MLPTIVLSMDLTVLHLAAPSISAALAPTGPQLLWILDVYGFMIAGFLLVMGPVGDRVGRRRLLLAGAAAFGVASVVAALSTTAEALIVARAARGGRRDPDALDTRDPDRPLHGPSPARPRHRVLDDRLHRRRSRLVLSV
jgi:hypothetical protein